MQKKKKPKRQKKPFFSAHCNVLIANSTVQTLQNNNWRFHGFAMFNILRAHI